MQKKIWKNNDFTILIKNNFMNIPSLLNTFKVELEINENVDIQVIKPLIETLKPFGVSIALDNFLAGCSSFNCLQKFQIETVKLDKCMIENALNNKKDAAIVLGIINLVHSMGIAVAAQGINTEEQMQFVRANGCDKAQGNYISKPIDSKQLLVFMRNQKMT